MVAGYYLLILFTLQHKQRSYSCNPVLVERYRTELEISHWPFSNKFSHLAEQI